MRKVSAWVRCPPIQRRRDGRTHTSASTISSCPTACSSFFFFCVCIVKECGLLRGLVIFFWGGGAFVDECFGREFICPQCLLTRALASLATLGGSRRVYQRFWPSCERRLGANMWWFRNPFTRVLYLDFCIKDAGNIVGFNAKLCCLRDWVREWRNAEKYNGKVTFAGDEWQHPPSGNSTSTLPNGTKREI